MDYEEVQARIAERRKLTAAERLKTWGETRGWPIAQAFEDLGEAIAQMAEEHEERMKR